MSPSVTYVDRFGLRYFRESQRREHTMSPYRSFTDDNARPTNNASVPLSPLAASLLSQQWTTRDEIRYIDGLGTWTMRKHGVAPRHVLLRRYLTISARRPAETFGDIDAEVVRIHAQALLNEALTELRG